VVAAAVVGFAHAHRVVSEVDIAVIALKRQSYSSLEGGVYLQKSNNRSVGSLKSGEGILIFRHLDNLTADGSN